MYTLEKAITKHLWEVSGRYECGHNVSCLVGGVSKDVGQE